MSKGKIDKQRYRRGLDEDGFVQIERDDQTIICGMDPTSGEIDNDGLTRIIHCLNACDGLKNPNKTIPKLVQLAKEITYASNEVSGCFLRDAIEALEGVSDE